MSQRIATLLISIAASAVPVIAAAQDDQQDLGNWFNDPFFQVRNAVPDCPEPIGPRLTKAEAKAQEHYRVERGTSCYLSGECKKPNSYFYDPDIATLVRRIFDSDPAAAKQSTLWITVTRRFVYVEGCSADKSEISALEAKVREVPDVQLVLTNVAIDPHGHLPYQTLNASHH